jgi:hypothetical protein
MINTIVILLISCFFVFNQVFFFDSFTFKIGLILFPIYYFFFKNNFFAKNLYIISMFIYLELLSDSLTIVGVLLYFLIKDVLSSLKRNFSVEYVEYIEIASVQVLYYFLTSNFPGFEYLLNLSVFILLILVRFFRRNGYLRFNKN